MRWITVHPGGGKGQPVLIDTDSGKIQAGMGGKFNGQKIGEIGKDGKGSQGKGKDEAKKPDVKKPEPKPETSDSQGKEETAAERRKRLRDYWAQMAKEQGSEQTDPASEPEPEPEPKPEPPAEPKPAPADKTHSPGSLFADDKPTSEPAEDPNATPRERAEARQRQLDADYEHARASAIPNAGEDLKGSARHKVNAWKSLEQAEQDGTAAALVTRDQLLKNEPHELGMHVESNPIISLLMHEALRAFPPKPGYGRHSKGKEQQDRADYLDAYRAIKTAAEKVAASGEDNPLTASRSLGSAVMKEIERLRSGNRYNNTANALINLANGLLSPRRTNSPVTKVAKFAAELKAKADAESQQFRQAIIDATHEAMEGKSLNSILGKKGESKPRFNAADSYVAIAERKGGPSVPAKTAKEATSYLVEQIGMRGIQFGNTVSDKEREHHAKMAAGAMVDLASVLGVPVNAVSLDGKLGLAMGARGSGNALAHYEPGNKVINLTRKKGVGSLAHEWAHAFDHHMSGGEEPMMSSRGTMDVSYQSELTGISYSGQRVGDRWVSTKEDRSGEPIFKEMDAVRKAMGSSGFQRRLPEAIEAAGISGKKVSYWTSGREMFARCFERYVQRKLEKDDRKNTYLAGIETKAYKSGGLWPTDSEVDAMAPAFDALIDAYRTEKLGVAERVKYSAADRDRFMLQLADHYLEQYRTNAEVYRTNAKPETPAAPSPGSKSNKPQMTTGTFGDKGRFITIDGRAVFIESKESIAKKRKRRDDARAPFVPKTEVDKAIVDYVGNKKHVVEAFRPYVEDAHKYLSQERAEVTHAMREVLSQFGYTGKKASAFLSNLRHKRDHSQIPGFDEMAEYAAKYRPAMLSADHGESATTSDIEHSLFRRLREGFPPPPAKHSQEVMELAGQMAGPSSYWDGDGDDDYLSDPLQQIDDVPFSAAAASVTERYAAIFARSFAQNYAAMAGK